MDFTLLYIVLSNFIVSLISLVGVITLSINDKTLNKIVFYLVSFAAGALIGGGFLHLLPEAVEKINSLNIYIILIIGFICFFIFEKLLDYHQCHNVEKDHICEQHSFKWLNLIGDGIHNFTDGLVIAVSFISSFQLGFVATILVIAHEIPQEIGDFGVLIYGGFSKKRALFFNFLTALTAIGGGIFGYYLLYSLLSISPYLLAFSAGGFIYIAAADLIPELKKENSGKKTTFISILFIIGIFLMWFFKVIFV
ncbi:MAG: ZIP family metal transporter [Candidatus Helarchaeota archaeon]